MQINTVTVISLTGQLDQPAGEQLDERLRDKILQGNKKLILDFKNVDLTSSEGLRALLGSIKNIRSGGGDIFIVNTSAIVDNILKTTGFSNLIQTFDDIDTALNSFHKINF